MEILELIEKKELTQDECLFIIKKYIQARKNVVVNPIIVTTVPDVVIVMQLEKMTQFAMDAIVWFINNKNKI
jgi:hypothetical protein